MKNIFILIFSFSASFLFANSGDPVVKNVNTEASTVAWLGKKVTGKHNGTINIQSGALEFDEETLTGGSFTIDMNSMKCLDLGEKGANKLIGHLMSDDFFGVANHPTAKMTILKVTPKESVGGYTILANLEIKGISKEYTFEANVSGQSASAEIIINRTDFDIRYGSGSFFQDLGDKAIDDEFTLNVNLVLE